MTSTLTLKSYTLQLFEYNFYCNEKIAVEITNNKTQVSENAIKLFSHVLNAHHIWNRRILGTPPKFSVWDIQKPENFLDLNKENYQTSLSILEHTELDKNIDYRTSKGDAFTNQVIDILYHIINHSTYHRAQVATDFRTNGMQPLSTDYIFFKR